MEIVLSLLRTLVFVVVTVAATVYVARRIGRGRPLLWTGTTLLALHWLVHFGWTAYLTGAGTPAPGLAGWAEWAGHLLPFGAALAYIWGIGQAAGFPSRKEAGGDAGAGAGAALGKGGTAAGKGAADPAPPAVGAPPRTAGSATGGAGSRAVPPPGPVISPSASTKPGEPPEKKPGVR